MTNSETLKQWDDEYIKVLTEKTDILNETLSAKEEEFKLNVSKSIIVPFGEFLYTSLGDRVTGQRSSVLNKDWFNNSINGQRITERATANGKTIEEQLQKDAVSYYAHRTFSHITAGRKFGFSYYARGGARLQTKYFKPENCFRFLTQEHVNCIKNKQKKECTQDFLNYRDEFTNKLHGFKQVFDVDIPIQVAKISSITKSIL